MSFDANQMEAQGKPSIVLFNAHLLDNAAGESDAVQIDNLSGLYVTAHAKHRGAVVDPALAVTVQTSDNGTSWDDSLPLDDFTESGSQEASLTTAGPYVRVSYTADDEWSLSVAVVPAGAFA